MTSNEFTLWLHGYLEALETEGIEKIKISNIREKMGEIKNSPNQERIVYGPNVKRAEQQGYVNPDTGRSV
tara:strand:+ start:105 stop:314 length:210 start_codon:yes stop_codon:yes gene_type:complete